MKDIYDDDPFFLALEMLWREKLGPALGKARMTRESLSARIDFLANRTLPSGITVFNCTERELTFRDDRGFEVLVPTCGVRLPLNVLEYNFANGSVLLPELRVLSAVMPVVVEPSVIADAEIALLLEHDCMLIGNDDVARAFPNFIVTPVLVDGHIPRLPSYQRWNPSEFRSYRGHIEQKGFLATIHQRDE